MSQTSNTVSSTSISREAIKVDKKEIKTVRESIIGKNGYSYTNGTHETNGDQEFYQLSGKSYQGKRAVDLGMSFFASILFFALYPFIAAGIKLNSRGPVLYKQRRTGQNGLEFICYKFRTMHFFDMHRYDGKPVVTEKNDKRIFWFGKLLRKTNLDELPQILNVMKGEMSLIGPRPYPVKECAYWNNTFDDFYYRYKVKPGVSGLAQVNGYRGGTLNEDLMRKRLDYDLIYVQKQTLWLDVKILFRTLSKLVNMNKDAH